MSVAVCAVLLKYAATDPMFSQSTRQRLHSVLRGLCVLCDAPGFILRASQTCSAARSLDVSACISKYQNGILRISRAVHTSSLTGLHRAYGY